MNGGLQPSPPSKTLPLKAFPAAPAQHVSSLCGPEHPKSPAVRLSQVTISRPSLRRLLRRLTCQADILAKDHPTLRSSASAVSARLTSSTASYRCSRAQQTAVCRFQPCPLGPTSSEEATYPAWPISSSAPQHRDVAHARRDLDHQLNGHILASLTSLLYPASLRHR